MDGMQAYDRDAEALYPPGGETTSWDNFSFKNLENLAESNLAMHDALLQTGLISETKSRVKAKPA
eukprot:scaffold439173_cov46-Prasinocladus_malaysianus.AAC.1